MSKKKKSPRKRKDPALKNLMEMPKIDINEEDLYNLLKSQTSDSSLSSTDELKRRGIYYITGEIEENSLLDLHQDLILRDLDQDWQDDIQLIVNSVGGITSEGWALTDLMDFVRMDFRTVGIGEICSLGTCIVANGTKGKRFLAPNCSVLVHGMSACLPGGNKHQIVSQMKFVMDEHKRELEFWVRNSKYETPEDVEKYLIKEVDVIMTPEEALEHGIVDGIIGRSHSKGKKVGTSQKKKS